MAFLYAFEYVIYIANELETKCCIFSVSLYELLCLKNVRKFKSSKEGCYFKSLNFESRSQ